MNEPSHFHVRRWGTVVSIMAHNWRATRGHENPTRSSIEVACRLSTSSGSPVVGGLTAPGSLFSPGYGLEVHDNSGEPSLPEHRDQGNGRALPEFTRVAVYVLLTGQHTRFR